MIILKLVTRVESPEFSTFCVSCLCRVYCTIGSLMTRKLYWVLGLVWNLEMVTYTGVVNSEHQA